MPKILILYNAPLLPVDHPERDAEIDVLATVDEAAGILRQSGYEISLFAVTPDIGALVERLRADRPDAVVNFFEGFADRSDTEVGLAGLLEWLEIPFTGCPAQTLAVARNKPLTKRVLLGGGLPTAPFFAVERLPVPDNPLGWPVFVKPGCQDASLGIDQGSVVVNAQHLEQRVVALLERFGPPVLVERFLPGREFQVPVVETPELQVLTATEITFDSGPGKGLWPILTFAAKWHEQSPEYQRTDKTTKPPVAASLRATLQELALRAYTLLGMRDYGRIDFRVLPGNECYILEGNPNPDASPYSCLASGLAGVGMTYAQWVRELVANALRRGKRR